MRCARRGLGLGLLVLVVGACAGTVQQAPPALPLPPPPLPAACLTDCVTPYGRALGRSPGGVVAYSNCSPRCVSRQANTIDGTYVGMRWQCVEYARRWLLFRDGVVYGDVDVAADIWTKIDSYKRVADGARIALEKHEEGGAVPPQVGDLLIYSRGYLGTGHVAVVLSVDLKWRRVTVGEQNYRNKVWRHRHARTLKLRQDAGRYFLRDPYLLGWVRAKAPLTPGDARNRPGSPSR